MTLHPDDMAVAFGVLCTYAPADTKSLSGYRQMEDAWSRAMMTLQAQIDRRREDDLNAQYRYERARGVAL